MQVVIFGELLWDTFGTAKVLGGAALNVAWHLAGLGHKPLLISAVGDDALGDLALDRLSSWGLDTSAVTQLAGVKTGQVQVSIASGEPSYDILSDVAYDNISVSDRLITRINELGKQNAGVLLYYGSLALRSKPSRRSVKKLLSQCDVSKYVDINVRPPHFDIATFQCYLLHLEFLKLNEYEFQLLATELATVEDVSLPEKLLRELCKRYNVTNLVVTRGSEGSLFFSDGKIEHVTAGEPIKVVDTVGAGDGFSAMLISGFAQGKGWRHCMADATQFASAICQIRGAVSEDRSFYQQFKLR